jgi:hypothetical protein
MASSEIFGGLYDCIYSPVEIRRWLLRRGDNVNFGSFLRCWCVSALGRLRSRAPSGSLSIHNHFPNASRVQLQQRQVLLSWLTIVLDTRFIFLVRNIIVVLPLPPAILLRLRDRSFILFKQHDGATIDALPPLRLILRL